MQYSCPFASRVKYCCPNFDPPRFRRKAMPLLTICRRSNLQDDFLERRIDRSTPKQRELVRQSLVAVRNRQSFQSPERSTFLPRSLIVNKEVITRVTGTLLGVISYFYIDARTLSVVSMALRPKGLGMAPRDNLLLSTLCQIGDVALVHDESALNLPPLTEREGCMRLTGCDVQAHDGTLLGKVRDYSFNPDTGQIETIRYDSLGQPLVPESIMTVWEVCVDHVLSVNPRFLVLQPGAQEMAVLVHDGFIGQLYRGVQGLLGGDDQDWGTALEDPTYEDWKRLHGREFARYYGLQEVPATRSQADAVVRGMAAALPSPRQSRYSTAPRIVGSMAEKLQRPLEGFIDKQPEPRYRSYVASSQSKDNKLGRSIGEDAREKTIRRPGDIWPDGNRSAATYTEPLSRKVGTSGSVDSARRERSYRSGSSVLTSADSSPREQQRNFSSLEQVKKSKDIESLPGMKRWDDWVQKDTGQRAFMEEVPYALQQGVTPRTQRSRMQSQGTIVRDVPRY